MEFILIIILCFGACLAGVILYLIDYNEEYIIGTIGVLIGKLSLGTMLIVGVLKVIKFLWSVL